MNQRRVHSRKEDEGRTHTPPRIVQIDDDDETSSLLVAILEDLLCGVKVLSFRTPEEAWRELESVDPDLFITDLNNQSPPYLPDQSALNGSKMLALLAERKVNYPIIVISGDRSSLEHARQAGERAGTARKVCFIEKPFEIEHFQNEVLRLLKRDKASASRATQIDQ